ncbi:MAG: substrate-binding domain-containing protein [Syntrophomonadaceae bacterium]|jgi:tungstate transport system substrate-binding protein|nr:substrate-binding domain-containing protein [Syntrophomonadaceae bacterium]MDH7498149.1 substrate-binding domain-containing protein [Syntrophomonadaceae bacterium]
MTSRKAVLGVLLLALVLALGAAVSWWAGRSASTLTLATTTSTLDSGLLDVLLPAFERECGIRVKVIAVGTGQALDMGRRGDADVLLVHSPAAEQEFVARGYGVNRRPVMHNRFLLVGPPDDPARVRGMTDAADAFSRIAGAGARFVSRADNSGTHAMERSVWARAGITPQGPWYLESGQGMSDTLMMADEMNAYTLTDEATYLTWRDKLRLQEMVEGDEGLCNSYAVIAVNPARHPAVRHRAAQAFIDFLTGVRGQTIISQYGRQAYGRPLFIPDAVPVSELAAGSGA